MGDVLSPPGKRPLAVLRQRNFLLYWLGQFVSLTGSWMQALALSILIMRLENSATALGVVNFASAIPPALLLLYGGAVTDRMDKRRILIVTQVFFMVAALVLALLVRAEMVRYWHVVALGAVLGVAQAFDLPANQALVPELVERDEIPAAVQLNQAIFHGSRVIGPPIASILVAAANLYIAFLANALSFIPVIGTLLVIRSIRPSEHRPRGGTLDQIKEGYAYVRERPHLLSLLGISAATTVLVFPNLAVLTVYYVKDVLHGGDALLGFIMGFSGAGAFLGAMALLSVPPGRRVAHIGLGMAGICAAMLLLASAPYTAGVTLNDLALPVVLACLAASILGASVSSSMGMMATILQQQTPDALRGRVMSLHSMVFMGIMPFASLLMTSIVDLITMPVELMVSAAAFAVVGGLLYRRLLTPEALRALHPTEG